MLNHPDLKYTKGNDMLQTRVRGPRPFPPNIALYCDWVLWSGGRNYMNPDVIPELIYLYPRSDELHYFVEHILPSIEHDFVLVTSSIDRTTPVMMQERTGIDYQVIVDHPKLKAWFTENRDLEHDRIHALPIGIPAPELPSWVCDYERWENKNHGPLWTEEQTPSLLSLKQTTRIDKIFGCWYDRVRNGLDQRSKAKEFFADKPSLFDWHEPKLSRLEFLKQQGRYRFVLCPHGGGLDPNPKCFESILMGAIPIMISNTTNLGLAHLPVVRVDSWADVTRENLDAWYEELSPRLEDENLAYLMSNEYFVNQMRAALKS